MFSHYSYLSGRCSKFCYYSHPKRIRVGVIFPARNVFNSKGYVSKFSNRSCVFQRSNFKYLLLNENSKAFNNGVKLFARFSSTDDKKPEQNSLSNLAKVIIFASPVLFALFYLFSNYSHEVNVGWNTFVTELLAKGQVEKIVVLDNQNSVLVYVKQGSVFKGKQLMFPRRYWLAVTDFKSFEDDLREVEDQLGIPPGDRILVVHENPDFSLIAGLCVLVLVYYIFKKFNFKSFLPTGFNKARFTLIDPLMGHNKGVKFSDVAGLKEAKIEIKEFIDYLKKPEQYKSLGAKVPKGALLLGPPGCGKTLLAKAVATESNVPFLSMNGSEFIELVGGAGAAKVRDLFSEARKRSPCIIYIDEIDGIGRKRSSGNHIPGAMSEAEQTLNQLLVEMDGVASSEGVVTLASTNRANVLDKALLRPGRFDRHILIDLPNIEERKELFMQHLKGIRLEHNPEHYAKRLSSLTPGFSGADIANICNEAALHAARFKKKIVTGDDLEYAIERVIGGAEKSSSALSPEEKTLAAYHEAGRALVGWLSEHGDILLKISVVPRTNLSVGWTQFSTADQYLFSKEELFDKMCMALGGRAAESLIFNRISTKSEKDLLKVTKIAYAQVRQYGMNSLVGPLSFDEPDKYNIKPYSKQLDSLIDEESRKLISRAFLSAEKILRENKHKLIQLAQELVKRETMNFDDVVAVIGPPKYSGKKMIEPFAFEMSIMAAAPPESNDHSTNVPDRGEQN